MLESVLETLRVLAGLDSSDPSYDTELIIHANTMLMALTQMGVGPASGFVITGTGEKWSDFLGSSVGFEAAKTYIELKIKLIFDPPSSSFAIQAMKEQIEEIGWRLTWQADRLIAPTT